MSDNDADYGKREAQPQRNDETADSPISATPSRDVDASTMFAMDVSSMMNHTDMATMLSMQHDIYRKIQESRQALRTFNDFSQKQYAQVGPEFERNTKVLREMKADLDNIFRRIQVLRDNLGRAHPRELKQAMELCEPKDEE